MSDTVRLIPFERITVPTLVICGDKDPYLKLDRIREAMPELASRESRLFVIEGAAHAMMMERPYYRLFRETVADFLK